MLDRVNKNLEEKVPSGSSMHNSLSCFFAKGISKKAAAVGIQEILGVGLTAILVDALRDLITGSKAKPGEK
ncbi:hypothetical protein DSO57_1033782 [Entomophthora muscae]|uniref:Uncharacterized protein n=1 Tax=Entomophthora muscae TaxID=34485 RepID=A0ACC2UAT0_9FUNG|nr:hypothetical protein DSO57_1033782 [Entomophthora muscae]